MKALVRISLILFLCFAVASPIFAAENDDDEQPSFLSWITSFRCLYLPYSPKCLEEQRGLISSRYSKFIKKFEPTFWAYDWSWLDDDNNTNDKDDDGYDVCSEELTTECDCDDDNDQINPGAAEIWYDGVDQNCDNKSDYDKDEDGYFHSSSGVAQALVDCNDNNVTISPASEEVWYDGVDQNCDNKSDYDKDEDGYLHSSSGVAQALVDCNDNNVTISPASEEVWYDGVDQNCDNKNDYDQDEDEYLHELSGAAQEFIDCDDTDPFTHPGAHQLLEMKDTNCNGIIDHEAEAVKIVGESPGDKAGQGQEGISAAIGDVNGDGEQDIVIGAERYGGDYTGRVYVLFGPLDGGQTYNLPGDADVIFEGDAYWYLGSQVKLFDRNKDGIDDVFIGAPGAYLDFATSKAPGLLLIVEGRENWESFYVATEIANVLSSQEAADQGMTTIRGRPGDQGETFGDQVGRKITILDDFDGSGCPKLGNSPVTNRSYYIPLCNYTGHQEFGDLLETPNNCVTPPNPNLKSYIIASVFDSQEDIVSGYFDNDEFADICVAVPGEMTAAGRVDCLFGSNEWPTYPSYIRLDELETSPIKSVRFRAAPALYGATFGNGLTISESAEVEQIAVKNDNFLFVIDTEEIANLKPSSQSYVEVLLESDLPNIDILSMEGAYVFMVNDALAFLGGSVMAGAPTQNNDAGSTFFVEEGTFNQSGSLSLPDISLIVEGPPQSYFGFTVKSRENSVLITAPKGPNDTETGVVYFSKVRP